jgi:hypothetical protein
VVIIIIGNGNAQQGAQKTADNRTVTPANRVTNHRTRAPTDQRAGKFVGGHGHGTTQGGQTHH